MRLARRPTSIGFAYLLLTFAFDVRPVNEVVLRLHPVSHGGNIGDCSCLCSELATVAVAQLAVLLLDTCRSRVHATP